MSKSGKITKGPFWSQNWFEAMWRFTCNNFVNFDTGAVDFEALGREEYEFRKALFFRNFKNSKRARTVFDEAKAEYDKKVENGMKGGRPKKNPQDAPNGNAGVDCKSRTSCDQLTADGDTREDSLNMTHGRNAVALESGTSANLYGDASHREAEDASTTVSKNMRRVPQNEAPAHGFSSDSTLDSRIDNDKQPNEALQSRPAAERGKGSRVVSLPSDAAAGSLALVTNNSVKKPYGTCGHVMLSDEEGRHLREVYGENLRIAIDILDAYIENNGKAAKKYKNHAAVLRKGNWVYEKIQTMALNEKRIKNAAHQCDHRSFAQKDRDDRSNWLTTSIFENEAANG